MIDLQHLLAHVLPLQLQNRLSTAAVNLSISFRTPSTSGRLDLWPHLGFDVEISSGQEPSNTCSRIDSKGELSFPWNLLQNLRVHESTYDSILKRSRLNTAGDYTINSCCFQTNSFYNRAAASHYWELSGERLVTLGQSMARRHAINGNRYEAFSRAYSPKVDAQFLKAPPCRLISKIVSPVPCPLLDVQSCVQPPTTV